MGIHVKTAKLIRELGRDALTIKTWPGTLDEGDPVDEEPDIQYINVGLFAEIDGEEKELLFITDHYVTVEAATEGMEETIRLVIDGPEPDEILRYQEEQRRIAKERYEKSVQALGKAVLDRFSLLDDEDIIKRIDTLMAYEAEVIETLGYCKAQSDLGIPDYSAEKEHEGPVQELGIWIGVLIEKYRALRALKQPPT